MPAQFTKHFVQDLTQDIKIRQCGTIVFNADNLSNVISVDLYNGTEPYSGGGTVAGAVICPDGATVALDNGTLTGNVASVTLKADCFAIPGQIGVGVQVISGSVRTTVLKAIYNVELLSTDNMVDPDSRITASVTQLVADIEAATAEIPASDMASLMSGIAPTFNATTNYAAGAYVYYSGTLYRFTADHAAGSWTGTDATAVALGNDVSDLKSAVLDTAQKSIPASFHTVNDKCSLKNCANLDQVFITGKNIMPTWTSGTTKDGITRTANSDGSLSLTGTAGSSAPTFNFSATDMPPISNGDYTLSIKNNVVCTDSSNGSYLQLSINNNYSTAHVCNFTQQNASISFHLSETEVVTGYRLRFAAGAVFPNDFKIYPQIEAGIKETDFAKYEVERFTPVAADTIDTACFVGDNYVCAKGTMTGTVEYIKNIQSEATGSLAGKTIVCFGDSITGNQPYPYSYPDIVADMTGATVYNVGFGGCCMSDNGQERRLFTMCRLADAIAAGDFSAQENSGVSITYKQGNANVDYVPLRIDTLESIDWASVDYITIAYGTNDWNSNYGLDNENDPDDTTTYIGAFRYSVEKILTAYPNIKILAITPLWRFWDTNTGLPSGETGDYLDANTYAKGTGYYLWNYGDALIEAAKEYHIPVLDMYHNCMMNKYNRHQYFNVTDGTHPKYEGRKLFAEILVGALESKY